MCLSLVVITGFVGQISVVQLALAGRLRLHHLPPRHGPGVGFPLGDADRRARSRPCSGSDRAVSALRVRGVSLAVVTLAAAVAIEQFGFINATWGGGSVGSPVPEPKLRHRPRPDGAVPGDRRQAAEPGLRLLRRSRSSSCSACSWRTVRRSQPRPADARGALERAGGGGRRDQRPQREARRVRHQLVHRGRRGALYGYNFSSVSVDRFSRADRPQPDRASPTSAASRWSRARSSPA